MYTVPRRPFWTRDTRQSVHDRPSQHSHTVSPWKSFQQTTEHRMTPATETEHTSHGSHSNRQPQSRYITALH